MPNKGKKSQNRRRKAGKGPRGGPSNIPTIVANPKFRMKLHFVDESDDQVPYTGALSYKVLFAAVARQHKSHIPTPLSMTAEEVEQWATKFLAVFTYIQVIGAQAWGTPFVDQDKGSSTRFSFSLFPNDQTALPPPPFVTDSASGASDRPYGFRRGGPMFFADAGNMTHQAVYMTSADVVHFDVVVW